MSMDNTVIQRGRQILHRACRDTASDFAAMAGLDDNTLEAIGAGRISEREARMLVSARHRALRLKR